MTTTPDPDDPGEYEPPVDPVADLDALLAELGSTPRPEPSDDAPTSENAAAAGEKKPVAKKPPEPVFGSVEEFVRDNLVWVIERRLTEGSQTGMRWCRRWWRHPEVTQRLIALWRAWETLRLDPTTGMSVWWRDHLEPHLTAITADGGPLADCTPSNHNDTTPLPVEPAPAELLAALPA